MNVNIHLRLCGKRVLYSYFLRSFVVCYISPVFFYFLQTFIVIMPVTCIVVNCGSRRDRDNVSFYRIPGILNLPNKPLKSELSKTRRALWIAAIKRDDLTESKLKYQRVCSKHFITGEPALLENKDHPDWVPSQNMGHIAQTVVRKPEDLDRNERLEKRRKMLKVESMNLAQSTSTSTSPEPNIDLEEEERGTASQTDITMEELAIKFEQLTFASKTIADLQRKVDNSPFGLMDNTSNEEKWRYYTGMDYESLKTIIFPLVEEYIPCTTTTALSAFNQLLLTLIKIRLDLHFKLIAYNFKISPTTASSYFENLIDILYRRFKSLIIWPERSDLQKNVPSCFKEAFHDKTTVIIDCFEIFIEKPPKLITRQQCWSNYKHHHPIKFLIGITPQGIISFISDAWGGRVSDKQIVEGSNFCNFITPGDIVLADRGFLIKETLGVLQAKLRMPAFTKGKTQLHPIDIEETRQIEHVRIHVERVIGSVKNKFNILKGTIPISMLKKGNNPEGLNMLDKIIVVCCAFINISPPIIPL